MTSSGAIGWNPFWDWTKVSPQEVQGLADKMFDAANVPKAARERYYQAFHEYIYADFLKQR